MPSVESGLRDLIPNMHLSPAAKSAAIRMLETQEKEARNGDVLETKKASSPSPSGFNHLTGRGDRI